MLHWQGTIEGHEFESLEVIVDNDDGLIAERTIAYGPYPALKLFRDGALQNQAFKSHVPEGFWDYPENLQQLRKG